MNKEDIGAAFPAALNAEGEVCLYSVFGVDPKATPAQVKVAYYKLAKRYHPDRCRDDTEATKKFQAVGRAYEVLSDNEERAYYDASGEIREQGSFLCDSKTEAEWNEYWRSLFKKVETSDIDKFREKYVSSSEETRDILKAYKEVNGDVFGIIDNVMLASDKDEKRIRRVIDEAIANRTVDILPDYKTYDAYDKQRKRRKKESAREAQEADAVAKGNDDPDGLGSLVALIRAKDAARGGNPLDAIIQKYSKPTAGSKRSKKAATSGGPTSKRRLSKRN